MASVGGGGELQKTYERKIRGHSLVDAHARFGDKRLTAKDLLTILTAHRDAHADSLNCLTSIEDSDTIIESGAQADEERLAGKGKPLGGIPFVVGDTLNTSDTVTSAGTEFLDEWVPSDTCPSVLALQAAGAVRIGKSNVDSLGHNNGGSSVRFGVTINPYSPAHGTGGTNGGASAAVAARIAMFGLVTDTDGSTMAPAALCGTVAYRPTPGRYLAAGAIPRSISFDGMAVVARTTQDARIVDAVLSAAGTAGAEDAEEAAAQVDWRPYVEEVHIKDASSASATGERAKPDIKGVKVGVIKSFGADAKDSAATGFASFLRAAGSGGATVVDDVPVDDVNGMALPDVAKQVMGRVCTYEQARELSLYFYRRGARTSALDVAEHLEEDWIRGKLVSQLTGEEGIDGVVSFEQYREDISKNIPAIKAAVMKAFEDAGTGLLCCIATPDGTAAALPGDAGKGITGAASMASHASVFVIAGCPVVSIPFNKLNGGKTPSGALLVGQPGSDDELLKAAHGLQSHAGFPVGPSKFVK